VTGSRRVFQFPGCLGPNPSLEQPKPVQDRSVYQSRRFDPPHLMMAVSSTATDPICRTCQSLVAGRSAQARVGSRPGVRSLHRADRDHHPTLEKAGDWPGACQPLASAGCYTGRLPWLVIRHCSAPCVLPGLAAIWCCQSQVKVSGSRQWYAAICRTRSPQQSRMRLLYSRRLSIGHRRMVSPRRLNGVWTRHRTPPRRWPQGLTRLAAGVSA
jgi:hypothetical protein